MTLLYPILGVSNLTNLPLVSVVIPTHNRPDFLQRTVEAILNQTYKNIEVIVVSNGYNLRNKETIASLKNSKIAYFEQENSGGPASPRNNGIRHAKGDYIAFCDDDDLWMPEKLEKQVQALMDNPECGLCYTNMLRFDEEKEWFVDHEQGSATLESLLYVNVVPISSVLVKSTLIKTLGGFCESKAVGISEDYEFLLRYVTATKFYHLDEHLIKYWCGNNRGTATDSERTPMTSIKYFLGIMVCYYYQWTNKRLSIRQLAKPVVYHFVGTVKAVGLYYFQKIKG